MSLLTFQGVRKVYGGETLLEDVTFTIRDGDRIGVVGRNGAGKSTIFRLACGEETEDGGEISRGRGTTIARLAQDPRLDPTATILEETLKALAHVRDLETRLRALETAMETADPETAARLAEEHGAVHERFERQGGYSLEARALEVLAGLGVPQEMTSRKCEGLSGGERSRVALAQILLLDPDLMLLDEPTNHLDLEGVEWLEGHLRASGSAYLVVSHDRWFLNRVTDATLDVSDGTARMWPQGYGGFENLKAEEHKTLLREVEKQRAYIEKERAFIRRHLGSQRSREASGRLKRLERIELLVPPPGEQSTASFTLVPDRPQGNLPISARELSIELGGREIFRDVSFDLLPGDRLGIVGPNGTGKSTLLKILANRLEAKTGRVDIARSCDIGYFDQDHRLLSPDATPYSTIHDYRPQWTDFAVRSWLARFLFHADDVERPVSTLSGGERARLALARLLIDRPNVLFLDEPTNHLDIPSCTALEEMLDGFTGTLIVVSHDRWFLQRVATRILWIERGKSVFTHGTWTEAAQKRRQGIEDARRAAEDARDKAAKAVRAATPRKTESAPKKKKRSLTEVEDEIMRLEAKKEALHASLGDPTLYADAERVKAVRDELAAVERRLEEVNEEWAGFA